MGCALVVIVFWLATDINGPLAVPLVAVAFALVTWVVLVRPVVVAHEHALVLRNMLSDLAVPWEAVTNCRVAQTLQVADGDKVYHGLGVSKSARTAMKEQRKVAASPGGRRASAFRRAFGATSVSDPYGTRLDPYAGVRPDPAKQQAEGGSYYDYVEHRILGLAMDARADRGDTAKPSGSAVPGAEETMPVNPSAPPVRKAWAMLPIGALVLAVVAVVVAFV